MSQQSILTAIYEHLNPAASVGTTFKTAFGGTTTTRGRIYQAQATRDTPLALCVFRVTSEATTGYLGSAVTSTHDLALQVEMFFSLVVGVATAMASEDRLFDLLHDQVIVSADSGVGGIVARCTARGTPTIFDDAVSVTAEYRIVASKRS